MCTRSFQDRAAQGRIGACIKSEFAVQSLDYSVFIASYREGTFHGMALRMEINRLLAGELCLDRTLEYPCGKSAYMLGRNVFFSSETTADQLVFNNVAVGAEVAKCLCAETEK